METRALWEQACLQLLQKVDVAGVPRAHWRAVCSAPERPAMQQMLVHLALSARTGPKAERLGLYKAAHAVLPLHGQDMADFITLLLEEQPPAPEWADVFLTALAEAANADARRLTALLNALHHYCAHIATSAELRRAGWIVYHVRRLGYTPDWLPTGEIHADIEQCRSDSRL